jgi:hypothetical protein
MSKRSCTTSWRIKHNGNLSKDYISIAEKKCIIIQAQTERSVQRIFLECLYSRVVYVPSISSSSSMLFSFFGGLFNDDIICRAIPCEKELDRFEFEELPIWRCWTLPSEYEHFICVKIINQDTLVWRTRSSIWNAFFHELQMTTLVRLWQQQHRCSSHGDNWLGWRY